MVAQHFIEGFIAPIAGRKVTTVQVVPSQSLVELNAKPTDELLMSYKGALANILEDKAWHQASRQLLAQRPLQRMEGREKSKVVGG